MPVPSQVKNLQELAAPTLSLESTPMRHIKRLRAPLKARAALAIFSVSAILWASAFWSTPALAQREGTGTFALPEELKPVLSEQVAKKLLDSTKLSGIRPKMGYRGTIEGVLTMVSMSTKRSREYECTVTAGGFNLCAVATTRNDNTPGKQQELTALAGLLRVAVATADEGKPPLYAHVLTDFSFNGNLRALEAVGNRLSLQESYISSILVDDKLDSIEWEESKVCINRGARAVSEEWTPFGIAYTYDCKSVGQRKEPHVSPSIRRNFELVFLSRGRRFVEPFVVDVNESPSAIFARTSRSVFTPSWAK